MNSVLLQLAALTVMVAPFLLWRQHRLTRSLRKASEAARGADKLRRELCAEMAELQAQLATQRQDFDAAQRQLEESTRSEAARADNQRGYRDIFNHAPLAIVLWNRDGRIVDWNAHAEKIFGWRSDEILGLGFIDAVLRQADRDETGDFARALLSGQTRSQRISCVCQAKNGRSLCVRWNHIAQPAPGGGVSGVLSLGLELTASGLEDAAQAWPDAKDLPNRPQRSALEAIGDLGQVIEASPVPTFIIDSRRRITHWNRACEMMFGVRADDVVGSAHAGAVLYGGDRPCLADLALSGGDGHYGDDCEPSALIPGAHCAVVHLRRFGLWVAATAAPLRDDQHRIVGAVQTLQDITERKLAEQTRRNAEQAADDANGAQAEFLADVSRDIHAPLTDIIDLARLLLQSGTTPTQRRHIDEIATTASLLAARVNDVLDFSRLQTGQIRIEQSEFLLDDVLHELAAMVSAQVQQKGLELRFGVADTAPRELIGDPLRLNQVLVNLVRNAIRFTESGGVTVSLQLEERAAEKLAFKVSVQDTGIGMSLEQAARLSAALSGDHASTTRAVGLGPGLLICKHLVELMGGAIWLESQQGSGSTFHFTFWCEAAREPYAQHVPMALRHCRVLLIDEDPLRREALKLLLSRLGFRVAAERPDDAVPQRPLPAADDPCRIVFIGWPMAAADGIGLIRRIRQIYAGRPAPYLAIAAAAPRRDVEQALEGLDVAGVLDKPWTTSRLVHMLKALDGDGRSTAAVAFPHLQGVDIALGLEYAMNKPDVYEKMLLDFSRQVRTAAVDTRRALDLGDRDTAMRQLRSAQGLCAAIGALPLGTLAAELEHALRDDGLPEPESLAAFETELNRVLDGIARQWPVAS